MTYEITRWAMAYYMIGCAALSMIFIMVGILTDTMTNKSFGPWGRLSGIFAAAWFAGWPVVIAVSYWWRH